MFGKRERGAKRHRRRRHRGRHGQEVTLDCVSAGEHLRVVSVDDEDAKVKAIRLGVCEGSCVSCVTKLPKGPVVVQSGLQEIAIGRGLARRIRVMRDHEGASHGAL